jgi:hypothetical protein
MKLDRDILSVRPRESGDHGLHIEAEPMALGSRLRGNERWSGRHCMQEMDDA